MKMRFAFATAIACATLAAAGCSSNSNKTNASTGGAGTGGDSATGGESTNGGQDNGGASNGGASNGGGSAQCTAGQKRCSNLGVPQTCNAGAWQDGTACTGLNYCSAGDCKACGGTGGPTMVALLESGMCIDSTEVTRGQYKTWLDSNPSTSSQTANCTWNTSFTPGDANWPPTDAQDATPVRGVDWCDAYAYCDGVGKRLCGKISGGTNPFTDFALETSSQWVAACTSKGRYKAYPYGPNYSKTNCNGTDLATNDTVAGGSLTACQSTVAGFTGVFDMSGNVQEWEDSCDDASASSPGAARCRLRGGSYLSSYDKLTCIGDFYSFREYTSMDTGFRCCSK